MLCLRPLGCSKAQGKEKLRGVASISGKFWSQKKWRRHRFLGSVPGNVFWKWNDASKLIILMGLHIVFLDRLIGMVFGQLVVIKMWRTIVVFRGY